MCDIGYVWYMCTGMHVSCVCVGVRANAQAGTSVIVCERDKEGIPRLCRPVCEASRVQVVQAVAKRQLIRATRCTRSSSRAGGCLGGIKGWACARGCGALSLFLSRGREEVSQ